MAVGSNGSPGQAEHGRSRFARLTAASFPRRLAAHRVPPFDLRGTIEVISGSQMPDSRRVLAEQDTRPSIGKVRQDGAERTIKGVSMFAPRKSRSRMPIHQLLAWTRVDGYLAIHREIPRGMTVDLVLNGPKSNWRLVRGSRPRDEVLRGI